MTSSLAARSRGIVRSRPTNAGAWTASSIRNMLTTPLIYSLAVPLILLDVWVTAFQYVCFPIYGIRLVTRRDYFAIDRHRLPYLNAIEKLHCFFCSYAAGLFGYVRDVTARTEQYWCPIKHGRRVRSTHHRHRQFATYGDAGAYRHLLPQLRRALRGRRRRGGRWAQTMP